MELCESYLNSPSCTDNYSPVDMVKDKNLILRFGKYKQRFIEKVVEALNNPPKEFEVFLSKFGNRKARREIRDAISKIIYELALNLDKNGHSYFKMVDGNYYSPSIKKLAENIKGGYRKTSRALKRLKDKALIFITKQFNKTIDGKILNKKASLKDLTIKLWRLLKVEKYFTNFVNLKDRMLKAPEFKKPKEPREPKERKEFNQAAPVKRDNNFYVAERYKENTQIKDELARVEDKLAKSGLRGIALLKSALKLKT